jgi:hypothetical protein
MMNPETRRDFALYICFNLFRAVGSCDIGIYWIIALYSFPSIVIVTSLPEISGTSSFSISNIS